VYGIEHEKINKVWKTKKLNALTQLPVGVCVAKPRSSVSLERTVQHKCFSLFSHMVAGGLEP